MNNFDSPKNSIKEDELGCSYLAYYLAKIIKDIKPKNNAYVIGICGKWGDGKTTLINYIKEILCYSYQSNCNLDINNYKNVLGEIKSNKNSPSAQSCDKEKILNKLAIFNTLLSFGLIIITLLIKFNIKIINMGFINNYLICVLILFIFSVPTIRQYLYNLTKELFFNFLSLFYETNKSISDNIEIIDFNPWSYQRNEKDITENFFKVLGQKIDIKEQNSNINIFLQYATCLLGLNFPNIKCENKDIIDLKSIIIKNLKKENKKYLVIIDDLDRIQAPEVMVIFKAVKLLADFPNIIYLLSYDKEHLMNQWPFQNSNYIQKIVQLEKNLPVIPVAKLKEIYINRLNNIISNDTNFNLDEFTKIYDYSINKLIKNIRDINRFENSFNLSYIANKNINEIYLIDYILISLLEEFDKTTFNLIQQNKHLLFDTISPIDLKKHADFIQQLSKNAGFSVFIVLFANYLDKLEEVMNSLTNKTTNSNTQSSDVPQYEISKILDLFKFRYKIFVSEDNYRKISNKDSFDNYFLTTTVTSLITDTEYKSLVDSCLNIEEFKNTFIAIFSKNEDKFKDFCERLLRDSNFVNSSVNITNLIKGILNLSDDLLLRLFDIRNFCEDLLSILKIGKTITKQDLLSLLLENFNETNIIQQIYWYHELGMSNIDEYFKVEKFKTFNINDLRNKINTSNIKIPETITLLINVLIKIRVCELKPANFKDLTNYILTDKQSVLLLLKQCHTIKDCYYYFEFKDIQDLLIQYYFDTKHDYLNDTRFRTDIVLKILDENLNSKQTNFSNQLNYFSNTDIENAIKQEKNINENTSEEQKTIITTNLNNSIDKFMQNNIFTLCEKISDNPLVVKYILNCCLDNESLKNRLESYIKFSVKIINDLENLHIDKDIKHLIELKNKYTELYNDLSSSF